MKSVYKYNLDTTDNQIIEIQSKNILSVNEQYGNIVVYALFDSDIKPIRYEFNIRGTGHPIIFEVDNFNFLGTVKLYDGNLMFHVFYKKCS